MIFCPFPSDFVDMHDAHFPIIMHPPGTLSTADGTTYDPIHKSGSNSNNTTSRKSIILGFLENLPFLNVNGWNLCTINC